MKTRLLFPILCILFLVGCTASGPAAGQTWLLAEMVSNGDPVDLSTNNPITLEISSGNSVGGSSGCNSFFGEMEFKSGGSVSAGNFGSTEMACETGMDVESAYLGALSRVDSYSYTEFELVLAADDGQTVLTFQLLRTID